MRRKRNDLGSSPYTILVVDDQTDTLESVRLLLEREGHRVFTAASGAQALDLLERERFQLALVDYLMPRMRGDELVARIRAIDPTIQVILQTGYAGERPPRDMLRRLDIHGYHDKAEGPEKLLLWVDVALKAYAQLERVTAAERLKSDILTNISHEFRTPLNVIIGYSDMLAEGGCGDQTADALETIGRLRGSAAVLLELINDFLDMSRLEAGAVGIQLGPLTLASLRDDIERAATGLLQGKPVAFRWEVGDVPAILADRTKLRVVLFNLLVNAAKFTTQGEIVVSAGASDGGVWIAVTDTGAGIDPEDQVLIFDAFRQGRRTQAGGTGLGLAIARRLASLMGGELRVTSTPGEGSTFTLRLQAAPPAPELVEASTKTAA